MAYWGYLHIWMIPMSFDQHLPEYTERGNENLFVLSERVNCSLKHRIEVTVCPSGCPSIWKTTYIISLTGTWLIVGSLPGGWYEVEYHRYLSLDLSWLTSLSMSWWKLWRAVSSSLQMAPNRGYQEIAWEQGCNSEWARQPGGLGWGEAYEI